MDSFLLLLGHNTAQLMMRPSVGEFDCPSCGSAQTARSAAVVEQGVSYAETRTTGGAIGNGGASIIGASSETTGISAAAQKNQFKPKGKPLTPTEKVMVLAVMVTSIVICWIWLGGLAVIIGPIVGTLAWIVVSDVYWRFSGNESARSLEEDRAKYDLQWYCYRCGHIFHAPTK